MTSVRENFPDGESLEKKLESTLQAGLGEFLSATEDRREEVIGNLKFILTALFFLFAIAVFLFITGLRIHDGWLYKGVLMLALLWASVLFIFGKAWFFNTRLLAREINMALVSIFTRVFDRQFLYTNNSASNEELTTLIKESSLIKTENATIQADDCYAVFDKEEQKIAFYELSVLGSARSKDRESERFRGIFMVAKLRNKHLAETYISTESDKYPFTHQDFWKRLIGTTEVEETEVEWGEFEDSLHVASTSPTATRELLTPDILENIYDWWSEHKLNMRLVFKGDTLCLLLPETSIHIATSTTSTKKKIIKRYAMTLARPIWRGLSLVESVSRS